jgi:hypothetical protein
MTASTTTPLVSGRLVDEPSRSRRRVVRVESCCYCGQPHLHGVELSNLLGVALVRLAHCSGGAYRIALVELAGGAA